MTSERHSRWPSLDVLRGAAVMLVLFRHFPNWAPNGTALYYFLAAANWIGWAGVDLFFALSGFLVSNLLFEEYRAFGKIDLWRFLVRRAFKIYPGFYLLIALSLVGLLEPLTLVEPRYALGEIFFLQNYVGSFWFHTWSLAVEEHFYLMIGILFVARGYAVRIQNWPWIVLAIAGVCLGLRIWTVYSRPLNGWPNLWQTHLRVDSLFLGSLVGYILNFRKPRCRRLIVRHKPIFFLATLASLAIPFLWKLEDSRFVQSFGLSILGAGCCLVVLGALTGVFDFVPRTRLNPSLEKIGRCSYAIYLWHMPIFFRFIPVVQDHIPRLMGYSIMLALYIAASLILGIVLTQWIETPALRLRDQLFPKTGGVGMALERNQERGQSRDMKSEPRGVSKLGTNHF